MSDRLAPPARRLIGPTAAAALLVVLAGCSSATDGAATSGSSASAPASPGSGSASPGSGSATASSTPAAGTSFPKTTSGLAILILRGNTSITSAHLTLTETSGQMSVQAEGDESLRDGKLTAADLTEKVQSVSLRFIILGTKVYAQLPKAINNTGKPWVEIRSTTTDAEYKQFYTSFEQATQTNPGTEISGFVRAAGPPQLLGTQQLDGATVERYGIQVDVAKLPATFPEKAVLQKSGLKSIPVQAYIDQQGRTHEVTESFTLSGQAIKAKFFLTRIDQPVTIAAPPSSQVAVR